MRTRQLVALGCDDAQGFHLGRPQPPEALFAQTQPFEIATVAGGTAADLS